MGMAVVKQLRASEPVGPKEPIKYVHIDAGRA